MVTSTIYTNSQIVVVDIGSVPATAPWLEQTTYLIDQSGHTTAVLAQTDAPTSGVTLNPVPYTTPAQIAVPSSTAGNLPAGWAYEGCYTDDVPGTHALPMQQPDNSNLTIQSCVWSCYQQGYSVSGLESHSECFCGNAIYNGGTLVPLDGNCNFNCTGNTTEICGGSYRLSVYSNGTLMTYQSAEAQTSRSTTAAPTIVPSPTGTTSPKRLPAVTAAAAVIGAVAGTAITVALVYFLCRRSKKNRLRTKSRQGISQITAQAWPPTDPDRVPSWEEFVKDTEEHYAKLDESIMLSGHGKGAGLGLEFTHRPSIADLVERYEQLELGNLRSSQARLGSSNTYVESPRRNSPATRAPAQAHLGQPTSILKRPAPSAIANMAQGTFENGAEQVSRNCPATRNLALAKKGVRFGADQIHEFGRSPFIGHGSEC